MKTWEYQYGKCETNHFQRELNEAVSDGWKLVSFSAVRPANWTEIHYVFKKNVAKK